MLFFFGVSAAEEDGCVVTDLEKPDALSVKSLEKVSDLGKRGLGGD
jgi:hypothetical protein